MKKNDKENKKDWFTSVMITQSILCTIIILMLVISVKNGGKLADSFRDEYDNFMTEDYKSEDFKESFNSVKEYIHTFNENESIGYGAGGADIEFTGLDTLEGICFNEYTLNFDISEPTDDYEITSGFGYRISPVTGEAGIHTGIDMATDYGASIYTAADGVVVDASYDNSYGNYVKIEHKDNVVTIYAHCSRLCADVGQKVKQGDKIAEVGSTGSSTGNHVHFEMRKDNIRINPAFALFGNDI